MATHKTLYCSFCGKSQYGVKALVEGPSVFICDECVAAAMAVIASGKIVSIEGLCTAACALMKAEHERPQSAQPMTPAPSPATTE